MKINSLKLMLMSLLVVLVTRIHGQTGGLVESPDLSAAVLITSAELEGNTEWKYCIIQTDRDTILLTSAVTHDEMRPVCYWTTSSQEVIYEDRERVMEGSRSSYRIKIFNLQDRKVRFETTGFIWGEGEYNFDAERGLLFYFKSIEEHRKFNLMALDIATQEMKTLASFTTSGDPITGAPQVQSIDLKHKQLILNFENDDWRTEKIEVDY